MIPAIKTIETFEIAKYVRDETIWKRIEQLYVFELIEEWLETFTHFTKINYQSAMKRLETYGLIKANTSLQSFSLVNHDNIIDRIKCSQGIKENTKQTRAAAYISFTRFLSRRFPGIFKKAMPSREGNNKTFYKTHEKVVTEAMNSVQWNRFFNELAKINARDCLIAKVTLQGGKRIREVLGLRVEQIAWDKNQITFEQSKTKGYVKQTVISYPTSIMEELKKYIGDRKEFVFLSRTGTPVILNQVANTFAKAGTLANIPFKVTPHVLRASAVTFYKQQGFSDSDIQKITGHASSEMLNAYDKSSRADNASMKINLVC